MIRSRFQILPHHVASLVLVLLAVAPVSAQTLSGAEAPRLTYKFGLNYFVQSSVRENLPFNDDQFKDDESFLWERLRPKLTVRNQHVTVLLEGQDTHSVGNQLVVRKAWLDLLNAYVDVKRGGGWSFRIGRRQGDFDTITRLVRTPDFAAVVRSFDVAEVGWLHRKTDLRAFVFRTVDNLPDKFNTWKKGERLWTTFIRQGVERHSVQTYVTSRLNTDVLSETGAVGSGAIYAWEVMASGPTPLPRFDYSVEHILERGHYATDEIRAYALFGALSFTARPGQELEMRYVRTSGDQDRSDGVRGAYDTFYMAVAQMSALGLMRASNLHAISIGGTHALRPKTTFIWRVHDSHTTTLNDGWYSSSFIKRAGATSSRLGNELDALISHSFSPRLNVRVGYYRFFPGAYVTQTGASAPTSEFRIQLFGDL